MYFVSDSLAGRWRLRYLTAAEDFTHKSVDIVVDFDISEQYLTRLLGRTALFRGYPKAVRTDITLEFTKKASRPGP